jgi:branched-chain amino acid transport system permease protein
MSTSLRAPGTTQPHTGGWQDWPTPRLQRGITLALVVAVLVAVPLSRPVIGEPYNYVLQLATVILMWIALSTSWNLIGGYAGYVSLGNNVFFGIGGYFSGVLAVYHDWSPFLTAALAGLVSMAIGVVVGLITLRTRGDAFIIATIALLLMTSLAFDNWSYVGGSNGLSLPLFNSVPYEYFRMPFYVAMAVIAVGSTLLSWWVAHSKLGLGLRVLARDEAKAEVLGINTRLYKVMAYSLSAYFPAAAGAIWGYSLGYLRPSVFFTIAIAAQMVLMAIIGGRGTVAGPVLGAIVLVTLNEAAVTKLGSSELNIVFTGGFLLLVVIFLPRGIVGTLKKHRRCPAALDWD